MYKFQKLGIIFFLFFFVQSSYSQLTNFTLILTATDETCTGNGTLTFNVQDTSAGATILYSIYLLPNTTTPITVLSGNTYSGLSAGNYRVVATQTLGNLSNTQQQDIVINDLIDPLVFQLVGVPVSCPNNGSITVNVTQGNPVSYEILSGPIIVAPQTSNVFDNLIAGTYNIRVNDNCGEGLVQTYTILTTASVPNLSVLPFESECNLVNCNTMSGSITINAATNTIIAYPLTILVTVTPPGGGTPVVYNQTLTSGGNTTTEVNLSIPYYDGQTYSYNISITDACGNVIVSNNNQIVKQLSLQLTPQSPDDCFKKINIQLCNFVAPYTVQFLSAPAGFNPITFNNNHPGPFITGTSYVSDASNEIPDGNYVIQVTDACGRTVQGDIDITASVPDYAIAPIGDVCHPTYQVNIPNVGPPVTSVIITGAPVEANFTFPYDVSSDIVSGYFQMELTFPGVYTFTGVNICGDSFVFNIEIPPLSPPTITTTATASIGCTVFNGAVNLQIAGGPKLVIVTLIQAPSSYVPTLPQDVSQYIVHPNDVNLAMSGLPPGDYIFTVTDSCGNFYPNVTVNVPNVIAQGPLSSFLIRGCEIGFCSIRLSSQNITLQTVIITSAPASFNHPLPYDVSFNIFGNGRFYMNSLPQGNYTFYTKDVCNVELTTTVAVPGYAITPDDITVQGNCGSFNLIMQHGVNETFQHTYWLQKLNTLTNQWEHPFTGVVYLSGLPNNVNSYPINNFATNFNIAASGTFRILKAHNIFSNGTADFLNCLDVIKEFIYNGDLKIRSAYALPCSDGSNQVIIVAEGIAPLTYYITSKDGLPFYINNGTSNVFSGLAPAIYNFQVQDLCGNIVNRLFDINLLPEPTITPSNLCEGSNGQLSVQAISFLSYQWWKGTDTTNILSTTNVLTFNPFSSATTPGTYYVRIYSSTNLSCIDKILSFVIPSVSNPNAGDGTTVSICDLENPIDLFTLLIAPFDTNGVWEETTSSGMLNGNVFLPVGLPLGTYTFKYKVTGFCDDSDETNVTVNLNQGPPIPQITSLPETCGGSDINLTVDNITNATFQWTGPNDFTSSDQNVSIENSTGINSGTYTVVATLNGCQTTSSIEVIVKPSPEFTIDSGCLNGVYMVTVIPTNESFDPILVDYSWTGPNGYTNTINPISLLGFSPGDYSVTVTNSDDCSSTQTTNVLTTFCTIPNVITPNEDGSNDDFDLSGLAIAKIEIYSRWGRLVYEQSNYTNQWHGQNMDDQRLPDSTYFYLVQMQTGEFKKGWVFVTGDE
jgi:gliding motility-associated-like protein